jgi:hypothetical protein
MHPSQPHTTWGHGVRGAGQLCLPFTIRTRCTAAHHAALHLATVPHAMQPQLPSHSHPSPSTPHPASGQPAALHPTCWCRMPCSISHALTALPCPALPPAVPRLLRLHQRRLQRRLHLQQRQPRIAGPQHQLRLHLQPRRYLPHQPGRHCNQVPLWTVLMPCCECPQPVLPGAVLLCRALGEWRV